MTFTALTVIYLVICAGLGLALARRGSNARLAVWLAIAMICVQLALLVK